MLRLLVCFILPFNDTGDIENFGNPALAIELEKVYHTSEPAQVISWLNASPELINQYILKHQEFEIDTAEIMAFNWIAKPNIEEEDKRRYELNYTLKTRNYTCLKILADNSYVYLDAQNQIKTLKAENGITAIVSVPEHEYEE